MSRFNQAALAAMAVIACALVPGVAAAQSAAAGKVQLSYASRDAQEEAGAISMRVRRVGGSAGKIVVRYTTDDGSAKALQGDYTLSTGLLTWADGDAGEREISIPLGNDARTEPREYFGLRLLNPVTALGYPSSATLYINDGDTAPVFTGTSSSCNLAAGEYQIVRWSATLSPKLAGIGTAESRRDFILPAGCQIASVTVRADAADAARPVTVSLVQPNGATATVAATTAADAGKSLTLGTPASGRYTAVIKGLVNVATTFTGTVTVRIKPQYVSGVCPFPGGEHVLHEWAGSVGLAAGPAGYASGGDAAGSFTVPSGCSISNMKVRIEWDRVAEDLDLYVTPPAGAELAAADFQTSGQPSAELSIANPAAGNYATRAVGFVAANTAFRGRVVINVTGTPPGPSTSAARVVVADIDTGINPYHEFYYAGSPIYPAGHPPSAVTPQVLADFGIDAAHQLQLTRSGNFASDYAADAAIWNNIVEGELYWIKGTNLIVASYDTAAGRKRILPDEADTSGEHGVGTSSAVLVANPEAILMFVETGADIGHAAGSARAFLHPLVDIITTSYGYAEPALGNGLPVPLLLSPDSHAAVLTHGKLHFSSAANSPDPFTPESGGGAGPWWSIAISGIEEDSSNGRTLLAGEFPDFVSDWTQRLPYCFTCESDYNDNVGGTSFATPRSAGVASAVLLQARRIANHLGNIKTVGGKPVMVDLGGGKSISNWQLRRALEDAAYVETQSAYNVMEAPSGGIGLPLVDAAPWLQQGWGNLSALPEKDVVPKAVALLIDGAVASKAGGFCEYQTLMMQRRKAYWDAPGPGWLLNGYETPATDPYIYCSSLISP